MMRKYMVSILAGAMVAAGFVSQAADQKAASATAQTATATKTKSAADNLVNEGQLAQMLVEALGLQRFLPANPSVQECFAVLLQNGIAPKNGWNSANVVTMGTLARVITQSLGKQSEVKNPADDNSWIAYLKSIGIEFGTVGQATAQLGPIDPALGPAAVVVSTDPLAKTARMRPVDEEQNGVDLDTVRGTLALLGVPPSPPPKPPKPPKPNPPPPTTGFRR